MSRFIKESVVPITFERSPPPPHQRLLIPQIRRPNAEPHFPLHPRHPLPQLHLAVTRMLQLELMACLSPLAWPLLCARSVMTEAEIRPIPRLRLVVVVMV